MQPVLDDETISRLKLKQSEHWQALFSSKFDNQFFNRASLVGIKHREIDLDPKWYIAGYNKIKGQFVKLILDSQLSTSTKSDLVATLDKYVALDMALALSSYSSWLID
jgi:methyl-accepting chemotaxis protein